VVVGSGILFMWCWMPKYSLGSSPHESLVSLEVTT
jgi:hypothetical protein